MLSDSLSYSGFLRLSSPTSFPCLIQITNEQGSNNIVSVCWLFHYRDQQSIFGLYELQNVPMCQSNSKDKPHLNWLFFFLEWTKMIFWFNTLLAFSYIWYLAILSTCFQHFPKITFGLLISERMQERWLDTYCAFDQVHLITSKKIETTKVKPPGGARHNLALHASLYIQVYLWVYKWYPDGDIAITALYNF